MEFERVLSGTMNPKDRLPADLAKDIATDAAKEAAAEKALICAIQSVVVSKSASCLHVHGFMTPPFDVSAHRAKAIQLFRHLLRESGYLQDPVARQEFRRQIVFRFRNNISARLELLRRASDQNAVGAASIGQRDAAVVALQRRMKTGRAALKTLWNANQGGPVSLHKVLLYAYGRTGKRGQHRGWRA